MAIAKIESSTGTRVFRLAVSWGGSDRGFIANKRSISRDFRHSASDEQVKTFALSVSGRISTIGVGALAKDKLGDGIEKLPKPRIFGGVRGVSGVDTGK